jgi:5'-AMP-activated protein kinase catalytic alpha subunit
VVEGLNYCHSKGIVHRDVKLDNLLLNHEGTVKICDFGVSKFLQCPAEVMTEQCGTPAYIAPEILKDKGYKGYGVDIWSLGVCLYAMLYGTVPFKANNMSELHQLIKKAKYTLNDDKVEISEDAKNLIKLLLEPDHTKRITINEVRRHKWLEEAYKSSPIPLAEIFSEAEKESIKADFTYQDLKRFRRNEGE